MTERRLVDALATGEIPAGYESQFAVILDEVPLPVVVQAVEEAAERSDTPLRSIWKNVAAWSQALHLYRKVWVCLSKFRSPLYPTAPPRVLQWRQPFNWHVPFPAVTQHDRLQHRGPAEPVHVIDVHARIDQTGAVPERHPQDVVRRLKNPAPKSGETAIAHRVRPC
ncbi:hypothetical protein [Burkholderia sola]|uniref:hypothetical protein n=1 Tax=Burkholderia sola TaxID=2843302 RepID=UPI0023DD7466|nr:hypothetical protein [Burkholderia sola]